MSSKNNGQPIYTEEQMLHTLATFFCPWITSEHKPGTQEYAEEVRDMLVTEGLSAQVTRDGDWYYCEPTNE